MPDQDCAAKENQLDKILEARWTPWDNEKAAPHLYRQLTYCQGVRGTVQHGTNTQDGECVLNYSSNPDKWGFSAKVLYGSEEEQAE